MIKLSRQNWLLNLGLRETLSILVIEQWMLNFSN